MELTSAAARLGHTKAVECVVSESGIKAAADELFHLLAAHGSYAAVVCLINAKADLELRDTNGRTPLFVSALNGKLAIVTRLLLQKADPNACTATGETPVSAAHQAGSFEVVHTLLAANADAARTDWKNLNHDGRITAVLASAPSVCRPILLTCRDSSADRAVRFSHSCCGRYDTSSVAAGSFVRLSPRSHLCRRCCASSTSATMRRASCSYRLKENTLSAPPSITLHSHPSTFRTTLFRSHPGTLRMRYSLQTLPPWRHS